MKRTIALVTGGNSGEYEVSLRSGDNIYRLLDKNLFEVYRIFLKGDNFDYIDEQENRIPKDKNDFSLTIHGKKIKFEVVFIAIHGTPGEDGKLQSYFDLLKIPYTGCDALTSALTFNKNYCNRVVKSYGVRIAESVHLIKNQPFEKDDIVKTCGFPCFVKPCNSGSSVGMSKVNALEELKPAIELAFKYDQQILIERFIKGREITCGCLRVKDEVITLPITEIISKKEFFDYEAKYNASLSQEVTPANIPQTIADECARTTTFLYHKLNCKGVVRMDYIFTESGEVYFLEVNTIPGQTNESIVPKQIACKGMDLAQLYTLLLQ